MLYKTKENEMLDWICWKHYGFEAVEAVLKENPGLAEYGSLLPAGLIIKLPIVKKTNATIKLWE